MASSRHHLGEPVRTQQQAIAGLDLQRVRFDFDPRFIATDDVGDDVSEPVPGDVGRLNVAAAHQVRHQRVVTRHLLQCAAPVEIRAAVADVHDAQLRVEVVGHGQRRAHAAELAVLGRLLADAPVGLAKRAWNWPSTRCASC